MSSSDGHAPISPSGSRYGKGRGGRRRQNSGRRFGRSERQQLSVLWGELTPEGRVEMAEFVGCLAGGISVQNEPPTPPSPGKPAGDGREKQSNSGSAHKRVWDRDIICDTEIGKRAKASSSKERGTIPNLSRILSCMTGAIARGRKSRRSDQEILEDLKPIEGDPEAIKRLYLVPALASDHNSESGEVDNQEEGTNLNNQGNPPDPGETAVVTRRGNKRRQSSGDNPSDGGIGNRTKKLKPGEPSDKVSEWVRLLGLTFSPKEGEPYRVNGAGSLPLGDYCQAIVSKEARKLAELECNDKDWITLAKESRDKKVKALIVRLSKHNVSSKRFLKRVEDSRYISLD